MKRYLKLGLGALFFLACSGQGAIAADYPDKPINLIVPFSGGGNLDMTARMLGKSLSEILKQPVVVENKPGAGGAVGGAYVAKSAPDGYRLLLGSPSTIFGNPLMFAERTSYKVKDLRPVGPVTLTPLLLLSSASSKYKTIDDLKAAIESKQGTISFAHPGIGTINQVAILRLQEEVGGDFISVPFKGSAEGIQELIAGRIDFSVAEITVSKQLIDAGKLRPIAVIGEQRAAALPDVPTIKELGIYNVESNIYTAVLAPAGTPDDVVKTLNDAMRQAIKEPALQESFAKLGVETLSMTPDEFQIMLDKDIEKLQALLDKGVIQLQ